MNKFNECNKFEMENVFLFKELKKKKMKEPNQCKRSNIPGLKHSFTSEVITMK